MKKILYILGFLMFSTALLSPFVSHRVFGADTQNQDTDCKKAGSYSESQKCVPFSTVSIFNKLSILDKKWGDIFGSEDPTVLGQGMYNFIYKEVGVSPEVNAAKNVTGKYGTTEAEMAQILTGNISSILKKYPSLPQEVAMKKVAEIQQQFQDEKDILALKNSIEATVTPSEMFTNGTTTDSGFDLVEDLRDIETILFLKSDPIDVGANWVGNNDPNAGYAYNPPGGGGAGGNAGGAGGGAGGNAGGAGAGQANNQQNANQVAQNKVPKTPSANPNICFGNNSLAQAVNSFDKANPPAQNPVSGNQKQQNAGAGSNENSALTAGGSLDILPINEPQTPPVVAAPAGQWGKKDPCDDKVFCLQVNFVMKPVELFQTPDNCIACHVEKINAKLKDTIGHSLTPGKATGNLMEPEICKTAAATSFGTLAFNFYAVPKPVQTPANDDLIYGTSIVDEWSSFVGTYKPFPFYEKNPPKASDTKADLIPPSEIERATKSAIANAAPDATFEQIQKAVTDELNANQQLRNQQIGIAEPSTQSDNDVGFYQSILRQLEQMNFYFDNFKNILHSLHEPVDSIPGQQACTELKNKKQCD
jgi:hypothetical protein